MFNLFNKIDLLEDEDAEVSGAEIIEGLKQRFEKDGFDVVFMSARDKEDITNLRDLLYNRVKELHVKRYPYHKFLY